MKRFALIGAAGFIAPRHMKAIKDTDNLLVAAVDKSDSVGILDSYFPEADFFTEFERFDRHIDKLKRDGRGIDYASICSPNYLHDAHIRWALRSGIDAICEKPLVLNPWNLDALQEVEKDTGHRVWTVLQLRLHPVILALKGKVESNPSKVYDIDLSYIASRGTWYRYSWKGDLVKSGGVATNIGIHFFDMLLWVFGSVRSYELVYSDPVRRMEGYLELDRARVHWFLSVDYGDLPQQVKEKGQRTYRAIMIDGEELEFSSGFTDLHTALYEKTLKGEGFGIEEARPSIELVYRLRSEGVVGS